MGVSGDRWPLLNVFSVIQRVFSCQNPVEKARNTAYISSTGQHLHKNRPDRVASQQTCHQERVKRKTTRHSLMMKKACFNAPPSLLINVQMTIVSKWTKS